MSETCNKISEVMSKKGMRRRETDLAMKLGNLQDLNIRQ